MDPRLGRRIEITGVVFVLVGLLSAAAPAPALAALFGALADVTFWPIDGSPGAPSLPTERWFSAIAGGLMVGWGAMLAVIGRGRTVPSALLIGGVAWFVVDGAGSVLAGAPLNVIWNLPFLALIVWTARAGSSSFGARPLGTGGGQQVVRTGG
jgi:hypothetical protein